MTNRKRGLHSTSIVQHKQNIQISHGTKTTLLKTQIHFIRKVSDRNSQAPDSIELWQSTNNFARNTQKSNTRMNTHKTTGWQFL